MESVVPRELEHDEVLVRILASGICPADVHVEDAQNPKEAGCHPRILGHEGSGHVEAIGASVTTCKVSDPVVLSFNSCGRCHNCEAFHPVYCTQFMTLNFSGEGNVYAAFGSGIFDIGGSFFGQSSFASRAMVKSTSVVNLAHLRPSEEELRLFAPLGCGIQTGAGALENIAKVTAGQDVAVLGVGAVGQSAILVRC